MPEYMYRREDGSTFTIKQKFLDDPLEVDPETGQQVVRVVQRPGVVFKGAGFYVNDSKNTSKKSLSNGNRDSKSEKTEAKSSDDTSSNKTAKTTETKAEKSATSNVAAD